MLSNMFFKKSKGIYPNMNLHLIILYKGTIFSLGIFCHHSRFWPNLGATSIVVYSEITFLVSF